MTDRTESNGSPSPEVPEKARRRRFEAAYKLRILAEADRCAAAGQLGELLRREGLYSSHLTSWRKQRDAGALEALAPKQRGRKPKRKDSLALERDRLRQAETIIEVQKKVSELLGISTASPTDDETN